MLETGAAMAKKESAGDRKKRLRREARAIVKTLSDEYTEFADEAILQNILKSEEYADAQTILCFISMKGEPSTVALIEKMLEDGKRVCIPLCTDVDAHIMTAKLYTGPESLSEGAYGIMEPSADAEEVKPEEIDYIIAPCVSCDRECRRLGHGAGYYDRFLPKTSCAITALCYEELIMEDIPVDEFDRLMDSVITEKDIYRK